MLQEPTARQGPTVRGVFDEETCRWHLYQIGRVIVPDFPFRIGMQKIYRSLLDMYGISEIADALSVLYELLEDESYEGSTWRSWRHHWRRRNNNLLDPFVPMVEDFELPQPTIKAIRSLKAANFFCTEQDDRPASIRERSDLLACCESRPSFVSCHSILQSLAQISSETATGVIRSSLAGSEQYESCSRSPVIDRKRRFPRSWQTERVSIEEGDLHPDSSHRASRVAGKHHLPDTQSVDFYHKGISHRRTAPLLTDNQTTKGTDHEILRDQVYSGQEPRISFPSLKFNATHSASVHPATDHGYCQRSLPRHGEKCSHTSYPGCAQDPIYPTLSTPARKSSCASSLCPISQASDDHQAFMKNTCRGAQTRGMFPLRASGSAIPRYGTCHLNVTSWERWSGNRLHKHISDRSGKVAAGVQCFTDDQAPKYTVCCGNMAFMDSNRTQGHGPFPHHLILLNRTLDTRRQHDKKNHRSAEKRSANLRSLFRRKNNMTDDPPAATSVPSPSRTPNCTEQKHKPDGACVESDAGSTRSSANLNKALPPRPLVSRDKVQSSVPSGNSSPSCSQKSNLRHSPTSTTHSEMSRASSKKQFHRITHELACPSVAEVREPSPVQEHASDASLVGLKYNPLAVLDRPDTPMTFSSFNNNNPCMDQYEQFIPPLPMSGTPSFTIPDALKVLRASSMPQSRSEPQIHSPKTLQPEFDGVCNGVHQSASITDHAPTQSRGRAHHRGISEPTKRSPDCQDKPIAKPEASSKRSRSPMKRLLELAKSQTLNKTPQNEVSDGEIGKKVARKPWGDRLRHGFLTNTESKPDTSTTSPEAPVPRMRTSSYPPKSTFPVSLSADRQAKIQCEMELMICVTANNFLKSQARASRMSAESVAKIMTQWSSKNRPQVVEFQFDQATQRDLVLHNINTLHFHGEAATNRMVLSSTMYAWKVMAKEMSVRTFCVPDSVIRKHLHDAHKVLELLGAGITTFLALQELQVEALKEIADVQRGKKEREQKRHHQDREG